jgi:hypothetical protein
MSDFGVQNTVGAPGSFFYFTERVQFEALRLSCLVVLSIVFFKVIKCLLFVLNWSKSRSPRPHSSGIGASQRTGLFGGRVDRRVNTNPDIEGLMRRYEAKAEQGKAQEMEIPIAEFAQVDMTAQAINESKEILESRARLEVLTNLLDKREQKPIRLLLDKERKLLKYTIFVENALQETAVLYTHWVHLKGRVLCGEIGFKKVAARAGEVAKKAKWYAVQYRASLKEKRYKRQNAFNNLIQ